MNAVVHFKAFLLEYCDSKEKALVVLLVVQLDTDSEDLCWFKIIFKSSSFGSFSEYSIFLFSSQIRVVVEAEWAE